MAQPSSHHDRGDRDRERDRAERPDRVHRSASSAHHHHRTISSTTLLLVLSLILAVLAVMLSIPSTSTSAATTTTAAAAAAAAAAQPAAMSIEPPTGFWGYLTPKRSLALVQRESAVALREAEVARREADLLAGTPGGIGISTVTVGPACTQEEVYITNTVTVAAPAQTVIKEVIKEIEIAAPAPPPPAPVVNHRLEELIEREHRISAREKDVGKREETVGKREADASRREAWIMDQLITLGHEDERPTVEEEVIYETQVPPQGKRKPKPVSKVPKKPIEATIIRPVKEAPPPPPPSPPPPPPIAEVIHHVTTTVTMVPPTLVVSETATTTVTVAMPSHTRLAANPVPQKNLFDGAVPTAPPAGPTRVVEVTVEAVAQSPTIEHVVTEETTTPKPPAKVMLQQVDDVEEEEEEEVEQPQRAARRTVTVRSRPKTGGRRSKSSWLPHW